MTYTIGNIDLHKYANFDSYSIMDDGKHYIFEVNGVKTCPYEKLLFDMLNYKLDLKATYEVMEYLVSYSYFRYDIYDKIIAIIMKELIGNCDEKFIIDYLQVIYNCTAIQYDYFYDICLDHLDKQFKKKILKYLSRIDNNLDHRLTIDKKIMEKYCKYTKKHCRICKMIYTDNHCCDCKMNYSHNHCCNCKMDYHEDNHCCICKISFSSSLGVHCCKCKDSYKFNHCCNCKSRYKSDDFHCNICHTVSKKTNQCNDCNK